MNLHEYFNRKTAGFRFSPGVSAGQRLLHGHDMIGLQLAPAATPQVIIENVQLHRPLRSFPPDGGWWGSSKAPAQLDLRLRTSTGEVLAEKKIALSSQPTLLELPWPALALDPLPPANLEIHLPESQPDVFLGISKKLERKTISSLCRGRGVEIGPGITPQILAGPNVDVLYAEEKSREDWLKTYAYKMHKYDAVDVNALPWDRYHVATAFNLQAEDNTLDFIFASHVFEHLVNPIGHLQHWLAKLKSGGSIVGILPHCDYSVDYQMLPSMLPTMALEYQRGERAPNLNHYRMIFGNDAEAKMAEGRTLHVHFYNERNLQDLFNYVGHSLPLAGFRIAWERNYKEFFFVVVKR